MFESNFDLAETIREEEAVKWKKKTLEIVFRWVFVTCLWASIFSLCFIVELMHILGATIGLSIAIGFLAAFTFLLPILAFQAAIYIQTEQERNFYFSV